MSPVILLMTLLASPGSAAAELESRMGPPTSPYATCLKAQMESAASKDWSPRRFTIELLNACRSEGATNRREAMRDWLKGGQSRAESENHGRDTQNWQLAGVIDAYYRWYAANHR